MSKTLISSSALAALAVSLPANAAITVHTDSGAFASDAGAQGYGVDWTVDYEELSQGIVPQPYVNGDMSMTTNDLMYSFDGGAYGGTWGTQVLGSLGQSGLTIDSAGGVGAMGMDVFGVSSFISFPFDTIDYTVFDTGGGVLASGSVPVDGFGGYFGVVSDGALIGSVSISGTAFGLGSDTMTDNVTGWNVPAPSGLAILGLGGLVAGRRRR